MEFGLAALSVVFWATVLRVYGRRNIFWKWTPLLYTSREWAWASTVDEFLVTWIMYWFTWKAFTMAVSNFVSIKALNWVWCNAVRYPFMLLFLTIEIARLYMTDDGLASNTWYLFALLHFASTIHFVLLRKDLLMYIDTVLDPMNYSMHKEASEDDAT